LNSVLSNFSAKYKETSVTSQYYVTNLLIKYFAKNRIYNPKVSLPRS